MSRRSTGPMIGITCGSRATTPKEQRRAERSTLAYRRALEVHGARVVELPPKEGDVTVEGLHGVVLTGGGDIAPARYGQRPHPRLKGVDPVRDDFELGLARAALERGLPVLGICRGAQVLGVAGGGDLVQDIESQFSGGRRHAAPEEEPAMRHWVRIAQYSRLAEIMNCLRARVNSFHHQANHRLGPQFRAVAWSEEGVIEAIEREGDACAMGVQWHPERMWRRAPRQNRLFAAFVAACREHTLGRAGPSAGKGLS